MEETYIASRPGRCRAQSRGRTTRCYKPRTKVGERSQRGNTSSRLSWLRGLEIGCRLPIKREAHPFNYYILARIDVIGLSVYFIMKIFNIHTPREKLQGAFYLKMNTHASFYCWKRLAQPKTWPYWRDSFHFITPRQLLVPVVPAGSS